MSLSKINVLRNYLDIFKAGGPFDELESLFHLALKFRGPFFSFDDAKSYIAKLESDPPRGIDYTLLTSLENEAEAILVINFLKPPNHAPMVVWGKFSGDRIKELTLIFDGSALR